MLIDGVLGVFVPHAHRGVRRPFDHDDRRARATATRCTRVQAAFIEHDALQCGFCTPGQILAAVALLGENPNPTEDDVRRGMSGNLCRCGDVPEDRPRRARRGEREPANG